MCGRYTLFVDQAEIEDRFDVRFVDSFEPRYNAAPGQRLPVITNEAPETIQELEWGFVPSWADDSSGGMINARSETVDQKPSFREAYEYRRCIVPANGFYEWTEIDGEKRPFRIAFEDDRLFAMAGIWERWEPPEPSTTQTGLDAFGGGSSETKSADDRYESDVFETFAILTTTANDLVESIHDRMPVLFETQTANEWIQKADPQDLLRPYSPSEMHTYRVSTAVNNPATDDPSIVEPVSS